MAAVDVSKRSRRVSFLDTCQVIPYAPLDSPPLPALPTASGSTSSPLSPTSPSLPFAGSDRSKHGHSRNPFHKLKAAAASARRTSSSSFQQREEASSGNQDYFGELSDSKLVLPSNYVRQEGQPTLPPPTASSPLAWSDKNQQPATTTTGADEARKSGESLRRKLISPPPPILRRATPVAGVSGIDKEDEDRCQEEDSEEKEAESSNVVENKPAEPTSAYEGRAPTGSAVASALPPTMTRPVAVRRALSLGTPLAKEEEGYHDGNRAKEETHISSPTSGQSGGRPMDLLRRESSSPGQRELRIPPVVSSDAQDEPAFPPLARRYSPADQSRAETTWEEEPWEEVALHGSCICANCEPLMLKSLGRNYVPPWTRPARKKYLADRQQAQRLADSKSSSAIRNIYSYKHARHRSNSSTDEDDVALISNTNANSSLLSPGQSPFLPDWLREDVVDEDGNNGGENVGEVKPKELKADEVDRKRGVSNITMMQTRAEDCSTPPFGMRSPSTPVLEDTILAEEVDQELRRRREQEKHTRDKMDHRRTLSNDTGGLRVAKAGGRGGGARAMMRQLEEAEKKERRADLQRKTSNEVHLHPHRVSSPRTDNVVEPSHVQMGAVKDLPAKPFTPPPRLNSPDILNGVVPPIKRSQSPLEALRARSPFRRTDSSNSDGSGRTPSPAAEKSSQQPLPAPKGAPSLPADSPVTVDSSKKPASAAPALPEKTHHASDRPSSLIQRELSLGIPLHNMRSSSTSPSFPHRQGGLEPSSATNSRSRSQSPLKPSSTAGLESLRELPEATIGSSKAQTVEGDTKPLPHGSSNSDKNVAPDGIKANSRSAHIRASSAFSGNGATQGIPSSSEKVARRHSTVLLGHANGSVPGTSSPLAHSQDRQLKEDLATRGSGLHTVKAPQISEEAAARREHDRSGSKLGRAKTWGHSLFGKMKP